MDLTGSVCRICLKEQRSTTNSGQMIYIFGNMEIVQQIQECTGVLIEPDALLPEKICRKCMVQLQNANDFRVTCVMSNNHLQSAKKKNLIEASSCLREKKQTNCVEGEKLNSSSATKKIELILTPPIKEEPLHEPELLLKEEFNEKLIVENPFDVAEPFNGSEYLHTNQNNNDLENCRSFNEDVESVPKAFVESNVVTDKPGSPVKKGENKISKCDTKCRKGPNFNEKQPPPTFICDQCGNRYTSRNIFETHLRRHAGDRQFQCDLCPENFFCKAQLKSHIRRHTGERPYPCKYCDRRFADHSPRIKHERTHTNERPYGCNQCGKAFNTSYVLKNHMLTHTGERSFRCNLCSRSFQRRTHLLTHYRSMTHKQNEEKRRLQSDNDMQQTKIQENLII